MRLGKEFYSANVSPLQNLWFLFYYFFRPPISTQNLLVSIRIYCRDKTPTLILSRDDRILVPNLPVKQFVKFHILAQVILRKSKGGPTQFPNLEDLLQPLNEH